MLLGTLLCIVALPLIALIAIGIKASSRGPVIYPQERVTWNGRRFTMTSGNSIVNASESARSA